MFFVQKCVVSWHFPISSYKCSVLVAYNTNLNAFFVSCIAIAAQEVGSQSPVSPTTTLVSPTSAFSKLGLDRTSPPLSPVSPTPTLGLSPTSMACPATLAASSKLAKPGLCARVPQLCQFECNCSVPPPPGLFEPDHLSPTQLVSIQAQLIVSRLHQALSSLVVCLPPNCVHLSATARLPPNHVNSSPTTCPLLQLCPLERNRSFSISTT